VAATEGISTQALHSLELYLDFVCPVSGFYVFSFLIFFEGEGVGLFLSGGEGARRGGEGRWIRWVWDRG